LTSLAFLIVTTLGRSSLLLLLILIALLDIDSLVGVFLIGALTILAFLELIIASLAIFLHL
ncbi:hypothetical protein, partial [Salmonella enterica]|uniref:hypothetical protein n=1 Tax=Salmonella enterica TaxID=28901 RepID=UPI0020C32511